MFLKRCEFAIHRFGGSILSLNLSECSKSIPSRISNALGDHCTALRWLSLRGVESLQGISLVRIAQRNPQLRWLNVSGCFNVNPTTLSQVAEALPGLTHLMAHHCQLGIPSFQTIAGSFKALKMLRLNNNLSTTYATTQLVSNMAELEFLDLSHTGLRDDNMMRLLASAPKIRTLILSHCDFLEGDLFGFLPKLVHLEALDISHCVNLGSYTINALGSIPSLQKLDISWCTSVEEEDLESLVGILAANHSLLKNFWFQGTRIGSRAFDELQALECLERPLDPSSCRYLTREQRRLPAGELPLRGQLIALPPPFAITVETQ